MNRNTRNGPGGKIYQDDAAQVSNTPSRALSPLVPINHETGKSKRSLGRRIVRGINRFIRNPYTYSVAVPLAIGSYYVSQHPKFKSAVNTTKNVLSSAYDFTKDKFHKIQNMFNNSSTNLTVPTNETGLVGPIEDNYTKHTGL